MRVRFGIKTSPQLTTWSDMLDVWREADRIEVFESAWTFDHFYPIHVPDSSGPCLEGWMTLAALANATSRIRIGCMVTGVVYRHPAVLANMAATVDIISEGRLELGIGAGWNHEECDAYGIELGTLTERFDRFDEACAVLVGLLTDETTSFDGVHFRLDSARCEPKPEQRPHPPICIGGGGPLRTLPSVARWAQHWNYPGWDVDGFRAKHELLALECDRIGRDVDDIMTSCHVPFDPEAGPGACAEHAGRMADAGVDLVIAYLPVPHTPAVLAPLADEFSGVAG